MGEQTREVTGFTIEYDGIYYIVFPDGKKLKACLSFDILLKIFNLEQLTADSFQEECRSLKTKNTTLQYTVFVDDDGKLSYGTSQLAEGWLDSGIAFFDFKVVE